MNEIATEISIIDNVAHGMMEMSNAIILIPLALLCAL
jgi:predicted DNA repair protein MutK